MTVAEIGARMNSPEFTDWQAFYIWEAQTAETRKNK